MRLGQWISGSSGLNLTITPFEMRQDAGEHPTGPIYRIQDVFSTHEGSWELSNEFGGIDDWARTAYWQGAKFDGSGGSHHCFVKVLDEAGNDIPGKGILFSLNGATWLLQNAKPDGSSNVSLEPGTIYNPAAGAHGPWRATAFGPADILNGVGLPLLDGYTQHVSTFVVFRAAPRTVTPPDSSPIVAAIERLTAEVKLLRIHLGA